MKIRFTIVLLFSLLLSLSGGCQSFLDFVIPTVDVTKTTSIYNTYTNSGHYFLSAGIDQMPSTRNRLIGYFSDGDEHNVEATKHVTVRISTDMGRTWGAANTVYDPSGSLAIQDLGGGFSRTSVHHIFTALVDASSVTPETIIYLRSTDGGVSYSATDLSSILPSDGLAAYRALGNMIDVNGILMMPFYKALGEGNPSQSANYLLRSTDDGVTWTAITVRAKGSSYYNEGTIAYLELGYVIYLARNEITSEYRQFMSTDYGLTWTDQGDQSLGESFSFAGPCRMTSFKIESIPVIACYYTDRGANITKVVYATAANLRNNGLTGWTTSTRTTILNTGIRAHYGGFLQYYNNMNCLMLSAYENGDLTVNSLISVMVLSTQYSSVKTALGL